MGKLLRTNFLEIAAARALLCTAVRFVSRRFAGNLRRMLSNEIVRGFFPSLCQARCVIPKDQIVDKGPDEISIDYMRIAAD